MYTIVPQYIHRIGSGTRCRYPSLWTPRSHSPLPTPTGSISHRCEELTIHVLNFGYLLVSISYFSRDFWRGLEIAPLLLESCLMISFQISLLLSLNICPNFDIFKKIVVQSIIIMGWIDYLRKYMLKP